MLNRSSKYPTQQDIMKQFHVFSRGKYENVTNDELAILNTHNQFRVTKKDTILQSKYCETTFYYHSFVILKLNSAH